MRSAPASATVALVAVAASCIATAPEGIQRITDQQAGAGGGDLSAAASSSSSSGDPQTSDPHAVFGADPAHGPFTGGQAVLISGKGFTPDVRVWLGDTEAADVIAVSPTRAQVDAPPGDPGPVDVTVQNGDDDSTRRTLVAGYSYDALYAVPNNGPTSGGTPIAIFGKDTGWTKGVEARVDQTPCTSLTLVGPEELRCTVPPGTPGAKSISVHDGATTTSALDAFSYQDSDNGFKGGLSGAPLAGSLKVLAFDNFTGVALTGGYAIVGADAPLVQQFDSNGVALFDDPALSAPQTVTVAAECHSPVTFAMVGVDSVTAYLDPILTPACAGQGDPPPTGGNPSQSGTASGELVWEGGQEFQKAPWTNVPAPIGADEARVAYLFLATSDARRPFTLPSSTFSVNEAAPGDLGYEFNIGAYPGNHTLYALAGIRNGTTGRFSAYAMGHVQGVGVAPGQKSGPFYIKMSTALDQALVLDVTPPPPGPKGPDRVQAAVAVEIAQGLYAILPTGQQAPLLPLGGPLSFVGVPALDGDLNGARYLASARAVTGPSFGAPLSVVGDVSANNTSAPLPIDGFVNLPSLVQPISNGPWNGRDLQVSYSSGGFPVDLSVYEITSGGGSVRWVVAIPAADHSLRLPDLSAFPAVGQPSGPLVIGVFGAHGDGFDYGTIGYGNLRPRGMTAYSLDYFNAHL
jgi:hypothetical protein